jgi:ferredoxin
MAIRVNPKLIDELARFGAEDVTKCYHCGNCSAVCPHSVEPFIVPRKNMRLLQMGLERKLEGSLGPWLCYYCGQCSEQCPRGAEPGETMMSLRRWLLSRYDFTGLAKHLYRSWKLEVGFTFLVFLGTVAGLLAFGASRGNIAVYDGPGAFLATASIHTFDVALAAAVVAFLAINAGRMWWLTLLRNQRVSVPWWLYVKRFYLLPFHFFTQMRYAKCGTKRPWLIHLGLMVGYVTMLVLIMAFLEAMQSGPAIQWSVHAFGYAATVLLLGASLYMIVVRLSKAAAQSLHTHSSDWIFLVLLVIVVSTGAVQHLLHRMGQPMAANVAYVIHLSAVVTWFSRYPFTKWSHIIYRPLGMYFSELQREALLLRSAAPSVASVPETAQ